MATRRGITSPLAPACSATPPDPARMREIDDDIFLRESCWPGGVRVCPRCSAESPYTLSSGRYRCAVCQYTFSDLTGRWLARSLLTPLQWLRVVHAWSDGASAAAIADATRAAPNTVRRALRVIGQAICSSAHDAAAIAAVAPALLGVEQVAGQPTQAWFALGVRGCRCEVITDMAPEELVASPLARWGKVLYSTPREQFDAVVADESSLNAVGSTYLLRRSEMAVDLHSRLWRLAKERAGRPPSGMIPLLLLLKECEFLLAGDAPQRRLLALLCEQAPRQRPAGVKS